MPQYCCEPLCVRYIIPLCPQVVPLSPWKNSLSLGTLKGSKSVVRGLLSQEKPSIYVRESKEKSVDTVPNRSVPLVPERKSELRKHFLPSSGAFRVLKMRNLLVLGV